MATYNEQLQRIHRRYAHEHPGEPSSPREIVEWAVRKGMITPPPVDPLVNLAKELARALREEYRMDDRGRRYRVNHSVTITERGVQTAFWARLESAPHDHMVRAFAQRRRQIVGECLQLKTDVDVYNEISGEEPVQLVLNFGEDVAELQTAAGVVEEAA